MLAMLVLARCCLILFFSIVVLSGPVGLCNEPGPPVSLLGAVMGLAAIPKGCFTLARLLHVNCLPVTEFGSFRRLTAAVTVCSRLEQTSKENAELKKELQFTKQKLQTVTEEKDRIDFDLEELEQYTRKNSLEIHGIPQEAYTTTEDVVLKIGEVLDVPISPGDIEISHQLKSQNKPIIVKFLSHKVKSSLYKKRTVLKDITVSDLFPMSNYATSLGRGNRIFLNENLTAYRRSVVKKANGMRKNGLLVSVWTIDGKIFVKTSPSGSSVRIHCLEDLDN